MQKELIDYPLIFPDFNRQTTSDESKRIDEQMRLLRSWGAVLREMGPAELGARQW
jgi:hypothetical protein